ncbi:amidohydrolase family protein [Leifsonia sp. AG29]|uniref:amidohydrolase family protein n=1 Tax=Leifsonia sp. AG29 TaxID=2598860 RepID=UPI00131CD587|nr:amidohydrolase family protein [Leifsonia sp. AG29]
MTESAQPLHVTVDAVWTGRRFVGPVTFRADGERLHPVDIAPPRSLHRRLEGTVFARLADHHTHLGLTDPAALFRGGITHAIDLGWIPAVAAAWLADDRSRPSIEIAGPLLTCPGGYPARSGWAPAGAFIEAGGEREARRAVRENITLGASRTKVTLNTVAGETVDDRVLHSIVAESHAHGVPVTVHVEGDGQTERAIRAGADQLAHTPFTESVPDGLIAEAVRRGMTWVTTLDIHGWGAPNAHHRIASENLARFVAAGGRAVYGTDLGNGDLPVGVNGRELGDLARIGLDADALVHAIAGGRRTRGDDAPVIGPRLAWVPGAPPTGAAARAAWLAQARGLTVAALAASLHATGGAPADPTPDRGRR